MKKLFQSGVLATGFAMFSMFFGAGNSIFPLLLGQKTGAMAPYAILGLILTAVCVPITGVISMIYYEGDYDKYFYRLGRIPGALIIALLLFIVGPLVAIPRCITLSYSTMAVSAPQIPLWGFSLASCALIYAFVSSPGRLLNLLGYVLTPLLLFGIVTIIVMGLWNPPTAPVSDLGASEAFLAGLQEGYNTLDLMAAFFFSSVVMTSLAQQMEMGEDRDMKRLFPSVLKSSFLAGSLLAIIYAGFGLVASVYSANLSVVDTDQILGAVAHQVLGSQAGIFATITVVMACFTTEITLAQVFGTYLSEELFRGKLGYRPCLALTLALSFVVSLMGFSQIVAIFKPIIFALYPSFIVLSLVNLAHKLWGFKPVKTPVLVTFLITLIVDYVL